MNSVIFDRVNLQSDVEYVLYVGQLKTLCLAQYAVEYLHRRFDRQFKCLAIVSDAQAAYPPGDIVAINPLVAAMAEMGHEKVSWRISDRDFYTAVSNHPRVNELLEELLAHQLTVRVILYEHSPEFTLGQRSGVEVIAPKSDLASMWNSKLHQYRTLGDIVTIPQTLELSSTKELHEKLPSFAAGCPEGMFVCTEFGAAGANSFIARSVEDVLTKVGEINETIRLSRYVPHTHDPTVLACVANENDVFIAAIADQDIVDGNKFRGSNYPTELPEAVVQKLRDDTVAVGRQLAKSGYRGIFGCDYINDEAGNVFFVEVNARKQGTTMEMTCTLENSLPPDCPSLMELEYMAVIENAFPEGWQNWPRDSGRLHWGTHNFKLERDEYTEFEIDETEDEREAFKKFCQEKDTGSKHLVMEHPGKGYHVKSGTFLARIVAIGSSHDEVAAELEKGKEAIEQTLKGRA